MLPKTWTNKFSYLCTAFSDRWIQALKRVDWPYLDETFLVFLGHGGEWVVFASKVTTEAIEAIADNLLHDTTLSTGHSWWEGKTPDGTASPDAARLHIFVFELTANQLEKDQSAAVECFKALSLRTLDSCLNSFVGRESFYRKIAVREKNIPL